MSSTYAIKDEMDALRSDLEKIIDNNTDDIFTHETILKISCRLDDLIVAYLKSL